MVEINPQLLSSIEQFLVNRASILVVRGNGGMLAA